MVNSLWFVVIYVGFIFLWRGMGFFLEKDCGSFLGIVFSFFFYFVYFVRLDSVIRAGELRGGVEK